MAPLTGYERVKRHREKQRVAKKALQQAIDTLQPEWADDCKMWISPPGPKDKRPRINWDIKTKTHALIEAHANAHGVMLDEVLYEVGRQFCMKRPELYWAMKAAKIEVSDS